MRELSVCREKIFALAEEKKIYRKYRRQRIVAAASALCFCVIIVAAGFFYLNVEPQVITTADLESKSDIAAETLKTDLQRALEQYEGKKVLFRVTVSVRKGLGVDAESDSYKPSFDESESYLLDEWGASVEILNDFEDRRVYLAELTAEEIEKLQKTGYYTIRLSENN